MEPEERLPKKKRKRRRRLLAVDTGAPPGTLTIPEDAHPTRIRVLTYDATTCEDVEIEDLAELKPHLESQRESWIDVVGLQDGAKLEALRDLLRIHPLAMEDVVHVRQRPKVEEHPEHLFVVLRIPHPEVESEQLSLFLGRHYVVTFQERPGDCFDPVRDRIRDGRGRARHLGADYLAYTLLDAAVDYYFPQLDAYGERLDAIEEEVLARSGGDVVARLLEIKRDMQRLRRNINPTRDVLARLVKEPALDDIRPFIRDCQDHVSQLADQVETLRETAQNLVDLHLSVMGQRMNEVMKVLTVFSTVFLPLSFIASLYGMNFDGAASPWNMPELHWYWGYPYALGLMGACAAALLGIFWKKGWLGRED